MKNVIVVSFRWECPCENNETVACELRMKRKPVLRERLMMHEAVREALDSFLDGIADHEAAAEAEDAQRLINSSAPSVTPTAGG